MALDIFEQDWPERGRASSIPEQCAIRAHTLDPPAHVEFSRDPSAFTCNPVAIDDTLLRLRRVAGKTVVVNDGGRFAFAEMRWSEALPNGQICKSDRDALCAAGVLPSTELGKLALKYAKAKRECRPDTLDYLIVVPTLRCNLACSYCQVSRAPLASANFDWSEKTLAAVVELVSGLKSKSVKIEFQGGEPTLRPDLIRAVMAAVPPGVDAEFVICTNLQAVDDELLSLFDQEHVKLSTSLDGPLERHSRQRHGDEERAARFFENLDFLLDRYGTSKISALPTIDAHAPPSIGDLIDTFSERGLTSIYLRPINYQGFARKRHPHSQASDVSWLDYHRHFIAALVERNFYNRQQVLEESYFSLLLRRIFRPGEDRHVDLRNPNPVGVDYIVIDYDGAVYPTDEARMLTRSGIIDLSIGDVWSGWDTPERAALNASATNDGNQTCERCPYKPFCGRDIFDDLARYGTITVPRETTEFCRRHLDLFDLAFEMLASEDEKVRYSLARWLALPGELPLELTS